MTEQTQQLTTVMDRVTAFVSTLHPDEIRDLFAGRTQVSLIADDPDPDDQPEIYERPCGCRTEAGIFMPCADHATDEADR